jgi:glycosyltransferase involved in cell wall biosynthesis
MKTASVIMTTKNRKEELLKALESAMAQRGLLEVIVIDDGSTDDTARVVERIAEEIEDRRSEIGGAEGRVAPEDRRSEIGDREEIGDPGEVAAPSRGEELVHKSAGGEGSGSMSPEGQSSCAGAKPELPVCEQGRDGAVNPPRQRGIYLTTDYTDEHGSEGAGPCLDKPSGAAFSNPFTSELARDCENTSLNRSAIGPASALRADDGEMGSVGGNQRADSEGFLEGQSQAGLQMDSQKLLDTRGANAPDTSGVQTGSESESVSIRAIRGEKSGETKQVPCSATVPEAQALDSGRSALDPQSAAKPQLRFIRHEVSAGYIVRRNEGARVARGDVIFSLDDDAVFSSPFVVEQTLRDFSHPRIGAVAIPYIEPHKANREMQRAPTREDVWITASYIGTAHAVRRDVFLALGGYREHLVHQGEEGDFCIRMLAADAEHSGDRRWKIEDGGEEKAESGNAEKLKREGTTDDSDKHGWGGAGERLVKPSGAAFSNPSTSELARDSENTSLTHSASGPASLPVTSHSLPATASPCDATPATSYPPPVTAPKVPGFFVRLGNSDPIIHNESPKRDYSRMDFYGRRNDVLFHWQNTPMPDLLWQLPMTIAGGVLCAYRVKRWRKMLEGIGAGFLAIAGGVNREPVSRLAASKFKHIKKKSTQI